MKFSINWSGMICLFVWALVAVAAVQWSQPPEPVGRDAPGDRFSAVRAVDALRDLLGDETPHPIGSEANRRVRDRLVAKLSSLGLEPQIQEAVGCSPKRSVCGHVENVFAVIPGESPRGVLLMAHYDSVSGAPGAADDGAGVATLIEIARALRGETFEYSLMFAFTDGEEMGLLGAGAFFDSHPWAEITDVVINLEGSGSNGPVSLLRAGPQSGNLVSLYKAIAEYPMAQSVYQEVLKHIPNDTDFTQAIDAGKRGLDFVFTAEHNHYHTPLDNIANLDPASVQHHGENTLPLVRALLAGGAMEGDSNSRLYVTYAQSFWLDWPLGFTWLILGLILIGLLVTYWRVKESTSWLRILGAVGATLVAVVLVVALPLFALWIADLLVGTRVAWPANPWPWRLALYFSAAFAVFLIARPLCLRLDYWSLQLGIWSFWLVGAVAMFVFLPLASYLLILPAALALGLLLPLCFSNSKEVPGYQRACGFAITIGVAYSALFAAHATELSLGLVAAPLMAVFLSLLAPTLLPVLQSKDQGAGSLGVAAVLGVIVLGAIVWASMNPLYSAYRPQHLAFHFVQNLDSNTARVSAISPNPLPETMVFDKFHSSDQLETPWATTKRPMMTTDPVVREEIGVSAELSGSLLRATVRSGRSGGLVGLALARSTVVHSAKIDGKDVGLSNDNDDFYTFYLFSPGPDGADFHIELEEEPVNGQGIEAYAVAIDFGLPSSVRHLNSARGTNAVPVHFGDVSVFYRALTLFDASRFEREI